MASREPELSPLTVLELRYLRKAIRYRLSKRESPPSGYNTGTIPEQRRHELDEIAFGSWRRRGDGRAPDSRRQSPTRWIGLHGGVSPDE